MGITSTIYLFCKVFLLLTQGIWSETVLTRLNLALIKEKTNINVEEFWNLNSSFNDPSNDKHLSPYYTILPGGNFRSSIVDTWSEDPPTQIAVMLFNNIGDLLFWLIFDARNADMELKSWMTNSRLLGSSSGGFSFNTVQSIWNVSSYQYILSSNKSSNISAWFATANFSEGNNGYPTFLIPVNDSSPFVIPTGPEYITRNTHSLITKTFLNVQDFSIDISPSGNPIFVTEILCTNLISTLIKESFKLEYSVHDCNSADKISYRDELGYVVTLQTGVQTVLEPISARCIWVTFQRPILSISFSVFGPVAAETGFITVPVMLFRGHWYKELKVSSTYVTEQSTLVSSQYSFEPTITPISDIPSTSFQEITTYLQSTEFVQNSVYTSSVVEDTSYLSTQTVTDTDISTFTNIDATVSSASTPNKSTSVCTCTCSHGNSTSASITEEELEEQIQKLKEELTVDKKELSSYARTLISVSDDRLSAKSMGIFAGVFLGVIFAVIVILDLSTLRRDVNTILRRSIYKGKWERG